MKKQTRVFLITGAFYLFCALLVYLLLAWAHSEIIFFKWEEFSKMGFKLILLFGLFPMPAVALFIDKNYGMPWNRPLYAAVCYPTFFFGGGGPIGLIITWVPAIILYLIFK
jgi:hypothetical protein